MADLNKNTGAEKAKYSEETMTKKITDRCSLGNTFEYTSDDKKLVVEMVQNKKAGEHWVQITFEGRVLFTVETIEGREEVLEKVYSHINNNTEFLVKS